MKKYIECYDRNKDKNDFTNQNLYVLNGDKIIKAKTKMNNNNN